MIRVLENRLPFALFPSRLSIGDGRFVDGGLTPASRNEVPLPEVSGDLRKLYFSLMTSVKRTGAKKFRVVSANAV